MKTWKHLTFEQRKVISNGIALNYKLKLKDLFPVYWLYNI